MIEKSARIPAATPSQPAHLGTTAARMAASVAAMIIAEAPAPPVACMT